MFKKLFEIELLWTMSLLLGLDRAVIPPPPNPKSKPKFGFSFTEFCAERVNNIVTSTIKLNVFFMACMVGCEAKLTNYAIISKSVKKLEVYWRFLKTLKLEMKVNNTDIPRMPSKINRLWTWVNPMDSSQWSQSIFAPI